MKISLSRDELREFPTEVILTPAGSTPIRPRLAAVFGRFSYSQPDRLNPNHSPLHTAAIPTRTVS